MTFRHTGSRENLISSQELVRASGFTQVKIAPVDLSEYPIVDLAGGERSSALSFYDQSLASSQARKNKQLLVNPKAVAQAKYFTGA